MVTSKSACRTTVSDSRSGHNMLSDKSGTYLPWKHVDGRPVKEGGVDDVTDGGDDGADTGNHQRQSTAHSVPPAAQPQQQRQRRLPGKPVTTTCVCALYFHLSLLVVGESGLCCCSAPCYTCDVDLAFLSPLVESALRLCVLRSVSSRLTSVKGLKKRHF